MKVQINGQMVDYDAAVALMDDDLREELASAGIYESEQEFANIYAARHQQKFGEEFVVG